MDQTPKKKTKNRNTPVSRKHVFIIGMGMSLEDLTEKHMTLIRKARILVGGRRHLAHFKDLPARKQVIGADIMETVRFIQKERVRGPIVILASGDPLFFGIAPKVLEAIGKTNVTVFPNITSVAAAYSKIKNPWSHVPVISLHGRDRESDVLNTLFRHGEVVVFTDPKKNPAWLAAFLLSKGVAPITMGVFERMGTPAERCGWYSLKRAAGGAFADPNLVILKRTAGKKARFRPLHLGLEDTAFYREKELITKSEVRAVVLSKLKLLPHHILWDLGSGSGAVAVEAAHLIPEGKIIAVEQHGGRVARIRKNLKRFGVFQVQVVKTTLPKGMDGLPAPDRVFIGGGGKELGRIIEAVGKRLGPGGIIVVNTVLIHNVNQAHDILMRLGFSTETVQVQINKTRAMPWSVRFEGGNPVWITSGLKGEGAS